MQRLSTLALLVLTLSAPAGACLERSVSAFTDAVEGKPVDPEALRGCRPANLDQPPPGSGNWPILASAALYLDNDEDGRWLLPWLSGAGGAWGHNGRESGSTIYEALNWSAALAVRVHACTRREDPRLCEAAGAWLKAGLAKWALATKPGVPSRVVYRQGEAVADRARLDILGYRGPFAHLVGDRQAEKPSRGDYMGSWVELTPLHPLLAWAADVRGRRYKEDLIRPEERSLPLWVVTQLTRRSYGQSVPADLFGLSDRDRDTLRAFLAEPADVDLAREMVAWLDAYPSRSTTVIYRRYASGDIVTVASHTTNANKSGAVVVAGLGDRSVWLLPSRYAGVGAATARGELRRDRVIATSNDGGRFELGLADLGPIAWQVVWSQDGARLEVGGGPVTPDDDSRDDDGLRADSLFGDRGADPPRRACSLGDLEDSVRTVRCLQDERAVPDEVRPLLDPLSELLGLLEAYGNLPVERRPAALERIEDAARAVADAADEKPRRIRRSRGRSR